MPIIPKPLPRDLAGAVVAFVLTLALAGSAIASGAAAAAIRFLDGSVDTEVVLLFVPLCALVFAIMFEVVRMASRSTLPDGRARPRRLPRGWRPGRGEG